MRYPTEEEISTAREMTQPFRAQINSSPPLLSLLYDIDLLPEQILLPINAARMVAVCTLFGALSQQAVADLFNVNSSTNKGE